MIYEDCRRSPALSPNLKNRLKYIFIARRVPIAPALLILGDEIANLATLSQHGRGDSSALLQSLTMAIDDFHRGNDCEMLGFG